MKCGATPTYSFTLPVVQSLVAKCRIVFAQNGFVVREFDTPECTLGGGKVSVTFTQAESLEFGPGEIEIEVQILTTEGVCFRSAIMTENCYGTLNSEVLS